MRASDFTTHDPAYMDSGEEYTTYKRYTITLKNVWMYGDQLCICSQRGEGFGIGKTYHFTAEQRDELKSLIGKRITVWGMMKRADKSVKWISLG